METIKRRKSVKLTSEEVSALKSFRKQFNTEVECAEVIGIARETLSRVWIVKSGSPVTVAAIRVAICKERVQM